MTCWEHPARLSLDKHKELVAAAEEGGDGDVALRTPKKTGINVTTSSQRSSRSGSIFRRKKKY